MWVKSHSHTEKGLSKEGIWSLWADVNNWNQWDPDLESSEIIGDFVAGNTFRFKPKGMKEITLDLVEVIPMKTYTDHYRFLGADLYGTHHMEETPDGLKVTTTIKVTGPLRFLWIRLVAQGIVDTLPEQLENLINLAKQKAA